MTTKIISAIDYLAGDQPIYRTLAGYDLPAEYRERGPECEHCHQNRMRKTVYVLALAEGGHKQVGSTCLADFIGADDGELVSAFREQLEADEDERIRVSRLLPINYFVSCVAMAIRENGWMGATKARETGAGATVDHALIFLAEHREPMTADEQQARSALEWARAIPDDEQNDYLHNLHILAQQTGIERKHAALIASVIVAYEKAQARKAEQAQAVNSQHFGTVGKRQVFALTVDRIFDSQGAYGVTRIHTMRDDAGNVAVWFASGKTLEVGKRMTIKATVKAHNVRDGIAQTILTRCEAQ